MNIVEAIDLIKVGYKVGRPVLMLSQPGVGKSSGLYQASSQLSAEYETTFGVIEIRAATSNPAELANIKAVIDGKVVDLEQDWVPTAEKVAAGIVPERGIVFTDEIGDGTTMTQSALQQILLDRRLGSARLAPGWQCAAASNRQTDRAAAGRISSALINRCILATVDPDTDVFIPYAQDHGFALDVIAFCRWKRNSVWDFDPSRKSANPAFCSPRSMEILSDVLKYIPDPGLEIISGIIGDGVGAEFAGFLGIKDQLVSLDEIIRNPTGAQVPVRVDVAVATIYALMGRVNEKTISSILTYTTRNEIEIASYAIRDLFKAYPDLPVNTDVIKWMSKPENASLISFSY